MIFAWSKWARGKASLGVFLEINESSHNHAFVLGKQGKKIASVF